jgi:hypothetical protein
MALNIDDENIRQLVDQYYKNLEKGIEPTKEQVKVMEDLAKAGTLRKIAEETLIKTLGALGVGVKGITKAMYDGQQGLSAMNSGVDSVVMVLEVFIALIPGFRLLKFVLGATVGAAAAYVKAANEQADALFKTYQDLSKTGMATAGGMTDVYNNMQRFNYGIKELGDMTALLKENSQALANFGGTAASGTKAFADAANSIQHSDIGKTFQMMGKTPDEINRGIAMFIKNQQAIGVRSTDINKNLASESARYVMQLDLLSKLTGQSAEQLQEKLDQAAAEEAFNQTQYELKKKADAGDFAAKKQYEENLKIAGTLTGTTLKEFQQGVGGDISAMGKTMMTASGAVALIQKGSYTAAEYFGALGKGAQESRDQFGNLMKMNATKDFLLPMSEIAHLSSRYADQSAKSQEEMAKAEQELQKKGLDPTTKKMVELRIAQQNTRDSLNNLVNKGVEPLTKAFGFLTDVINRIVGIVPGTDNDKDKDKANANISADTKQIMAAIRTHESGGNYQIQSKNSSATGAYQFLDSSWQELSKKYNIGKEYKQAKDAPPEVQDAVAAKFIEEILKANNNDVRAVFKTWYTGNAKGIISKEAMAKNNNLTADQMADQFEEIYRKQSGKTAGTQSRTETAKNETTATEDNKAKVETPATAPNTGWQPPWVSADNGMDKMITGPSNGYRPRVIMHGTEDLTITPKSDTANNTVTTEMDTGMLLQQQTSKLDELIRILGDQQQNDLVFQQLDRLDELNRTMQNQISVSTKILQASR